MQLRQHVLEHCRIRLTCGECPIAQRANQRVAWLAAYLAVFVTVAVIDAHKTFSCSCIRPSACGPTKNRDKLGIGLPSDKKPYRFDDIINEDRGRKRSSVDGGGINI